MSGESLTTLVKYLPTLLALVIILLCMIRGLMRGFRKSLILFTNYVLALIVGVVCYFRFAKMLIGEDIGWIFDLVGGKYAEANTMYEFMEILIQDLFPKFSGLTANENIKHIIMSLAGVGVSLVSGIVCLFIIPLVVRLVLYIPYLLFYREGKHKRHVLAEGDDYRRHRILGMAVGAVRGAICSFLIVSIVTSLMVIVSGDVEETKESDLLEGYSETLGVDLNAIYQGIIESKNTGVGLIYSKIKINNKPLDLFFTDLFITSNYSYPKYAPQSSEGIGYLSSNDPLMAEMTQLALREELTLIFEILNTILQSDAVKAVDGKYEVDYVILDEELTPQLEEFFYGSQIFQDFVPFTVIGLVETLQKDGIELYGAEELFTDEFVENVKQIDFASDMAELISVCVSAVELIPVSEDGTAFDFSSFDDPNTFLSYDAEVIKDIFTRLSEIKLITDFSFPISTAITLSQMEEKIVEAGIEEDSIEEFKDIDWKYELKNLGNIYEKAAALDVDLNKITDTEYLIELVNSDESEEFKVEVKDLIETVFDSTLLSKATLIAAKKYIAEIEFVQEDGSVSPLNDAFDLVRDNLDNYTIESLKTDLLTMVDSCLEASSLIPVFKDNGSDYFKMISEMNTDSVRNSLLGTLNPDTDEREGGIYDLAILNGDIDGDGLVDEGCHYAIDKLLESAIKAYGSEFLSVDVVDKVCLVKDPTDPNYDFDAWPNELNALIDAIESMQGISCLGDIKLELGEGESITDLLPETMTDNDIDILTHACSKSRLLSGLVEEKIVSTLKDNEDFGYAVSDENIVWMDTLDENLNVKKHGELNYLLKSFKIFSEEEKGIDLENTDSLINGLGQLIYEATEEEKNDVNNPNILYGLNFEEAVYFAKSQVIMTVLSSELSKLGSEEENSDMQIIVPECLDTEANPDNWRNWSYNGESNLDHKKGEFAKLILVLYFAREYAIDHPSEPVALSDETPVGLNMDNLLNSVIYMEKDEHLTNSLVLYATISNVLMEQTEGEDSILCVPNKALVANPNTNNGIQIEAKEIQNLFLTVRNLDVDLAGNDFENINLQTIIDKIGESHVREGICLSKIFTATTISKISESEEVTIPRQFKKYNVNNELVIDLENPVWYPTNDENWEESELNKILVSVDELGITVSEDETEGTGLVLPDTDELIRSLNDTANAGGTKIDRIYDSIIFRSTISQKILELDDIKFRQQVYLEEQFLVTEDSYKNVRKEEIEELVNFLELTDITLEEGFETSKVIDSLKQEEVRETVVTSNILNATVVDILGEADGLEIPARLKNSDNTVNIEADWYIVEDNPQTSVDETVSWDESELGMLLASVVELNVTVVDDTPQIPETNDLLKSLNNDSLTKPDTHQTVLDVVYGSEVIRSTIKKNILEQETDGNVKIRDNAFVNNDRDNYLEKVEIKELVNFMELTDIDIDGGIDTAKVIDSLKQEQVRETVVTSNILNATVVDILGDADGLVIPARLKNPDDTVNINADWYIVEDNPQTNIDETVSWDESELGMLLASVVELDVTVVDDTPQIPETNDLLKSLNKDSLTKPDTHQSVLDVVYNSEVIRATIKSNISEQETEGNVKIRDKAFAENDRDNYLEKVEIKELVNFMELTDIDIDGGIDTAKVIDSLKQEQVRETVVTSNILNATVIDILGDADGLEIPAKFKNSDNTVNIEADWYIVEDNPQTSKDETVSWDESELGMLLASVVELNVTVVDDTPQIPETNDLLKSLNGRSLTKPETNLTSLDVVYMSEVIRATIKENILEQETNGNVLIRDDAFVDSDRNNYLEKAEVTLLTEFANAKDSKGNNITIDNIQNKQVFDLLSAERNREIITTSNILNITVVNRFDNVKDISFPSTYLLTEDNPNTVENEQQINLEADAWYPTNNNWKECELAKLLASVEELQLVDYVDQNDQINMPGTNELLSNLNKPSLTDTTSTVPVTRLSVVYSSDSLSLTINDKIKGVEEVVVRQQAMEEIDGAYTGRIAEEEIAQLVEFVNFTNINLDNHELDAEHIFNLLKDDEVVVETGISRGHTLRKMIVVSNILNATTVDKIAGDGVYGEHNTLKFASSYKNEDGSINKEAAMWYPEGEDYEHCELYHMLVCIEELEIEADGNNISLSVDKNIDLLLSHDTKNGTPEDTKLDIVYHSDNIAMTVCERLNETSEYELPQNTFGDENGYISIYDNVPGHRLPKDKIIIEDEVENLLEALESLGINFHVEEDPSYSFDYAHIFDNINLQSLHDNLDSVLDSAVLHFVLSDNLISQKQRINAADHYIVVNEARIDENTTKAIVKVNGDCKYIYKEEIHYAIDTLLAFGINSIHEASNINETYLKSFFGKGVTNRDYYIASVAKSAIISKIFVQILISNYIIDVIEFFGTPYARYNVVETYTVKSVETLSQVDLIRILTENAEVFDQN